MNPNSIWLLLNPKNGHFCCCKVTWCWWCELRFAFVPFGKYDDQNVTPSIREVQFLFLFSLMKALLKTKEDGFGFGIWVYILHCTYRFLYFCVGKQDGMWLFLFETSTYNCCFQIWNQNHNNVYYIWGWDSRTLLPIFNVDWKQTWCLFC